MKKWFETAGRNGDIIISSRVRLARNSVTYHFMNKLDSQEQEKLNNEAVSKLQELNLGENKLDFLWTDKLTDNRKKSLVEQHLASPDFVNRGGNVLALSQDNSISIMINEEDHFRIQVILPGFDLEKAYETANRCDDFLGESFEYAFDEHLGYLTTCMTNLGTGLRASVMMHLPALEAVGALGSISNTVSKLGLTIRGTFGEGTKAYGAIYQVSNQITLGISEEQAIENLKNVVNQILYSENEARKNLLAKDPVALEDAVYRSYGILRYAKRIGMQEMYQLLSEVRLGVSLGILSSPSLETLNQLLSICGDATLRDEQKESGQPEPVKRAVFIQNMLNDK